MKLPRITLEQWAAFKAVVDEGSFARAAEVLNKSQSSVSYAIKGLEEQLPAPVFSQQGRKAELTEIGRALYRQAQRLLDNALEVETAAQVMARGWEPLIRIGIDQLLGAEDILCALERFSRQSPGTRITLLEGSLSGTDELVLERKADIVLTPHIPPGFLGTPLTRITMIPVANPAHPLSRMSQVQASDLAQYRQIVLRDTGTRREKDAGWLGSEQRWTVSHFATSVKVLQAGLGFAFLPENIIRKELEAGSLVPISLAEGQRNEISLYLVLPGQENTGPASRALAKELQATFAEVR